jgi:very-short-patch-repair endonuclease
LQKRARLEQAVRLLEAHASALRHVLPEFGKPAREIIAELAILREGRCDRFRRQELVEPSSPTEFAAAITALQHVVELRRDIPTGAADSIGGIGCAGNASNPNAQSQEFRDLISRMREQLETASAAVERLRGIGVAVPMTALSETEQWASGAPDLNIANDSIAVEFAAKLHRPGGRDAFKRLQQAKQAMRQIAGKHPDARRLSQQLVEHDSHSWDSALKAVANTALDHLTCDTIAQLGQALENSERALRATLLTGGVSTSHDMLREAPDYSAWRSRITLVSQLENGASHASRLCEAISRGSPSSSQLEELIAAIKRHHAASVAAGRRLDIKKVPDLHTLERIQAVVGCRTSLIARCWAAITSKEYRENRLAFKAMARLPIPRRDWVSEIKAAIELRESEAEAAHQQAVWGCSADAAKVEVLEAAHSWLVTLSRSIDSAKISLDQVWSLMRERRDPALEGTEKQTATLCAELSKRGTLLQAMNAVAAKGTLRLPNFVNALAEASRSILLASRQSHAWKMPADTTLGAILSLGSAASSALEIESAISADTEVSDLFGDDFAGIDTSTLRIESVAAWYLTAAEADRVDWRKTIAKLLETPSQSASQMAILRACTEEIAGATRSATTIANEIEASYEMRGNAVSLRISDSIPIESLISRIRKIQEHESSVSKVFRHYASATELRTRIGAGLVDKYLDGSVAPDRIVESYCASTYEHALRREEGLAPLVDFDRKLIERALDELKALDADLRQLNANALIGRLASAKVPEGVDVGRVRDKTDFGLVRHVVQTPKARLDLGGLYRRAAGALRALQPCTIATPTTVSEYLPRELASFDVVIIDEASQIEPASAIGSIARGAQVIIVGDPKQLPPTNFFAGAKSTAQEEEGDDDSAGEEVADSESILDRAIASLPNVHLRGHYRSKHHSLIEWSNRSFYGASLVVPPSSIPRSNQLGVIAKHVEGAFYSASQNEVEAKAVADAVMRQLRESPSESLGVVAFNVRQAELIEQHIIGIARRSREDFAAYARACESEKPLFIRSLESVQGDERDVIFISYTYGPDPTTKQVYQRFGPVLRQGGERRLNVLVTRARNRVVVFHSLLPEQIVVNSGGAPLMRSYLHHAMRAPQHDFSEGEFESGFERQVASLIHQIDPSLIVKPQVGCDGFRIDLGVAHQSSPHRFILGIECDGATYHAEPSARQRDMIRQAILEQHGWKIHRIWSTAWWHNFAEERSRLERSLSAAKRERSGEED